MSGKISASSGFVSKADFMRLQSKVDALVAKWTESRQEVRTAQPSVASASPHSNRKLSGGVKAWLYAKAGSSTSRNSLNANIACQNCDNEHISDKNKHTLQKRGQGESFDRNDNQRCSKNEFNQFQREVTRDIRLLQKSVRDVEIFCDNLEKSIHESLAYLQATIDKMNGQIMTTIERLDQLSSQNKVTGSRASTAMAVQNKTTRIF